MSAVISGAAWDLTDTHSRWMTLIWEITECILTPRPSYREPRSHQTDEWAYPPPIEIARTVTRKCTRTPTHEPLDRMNRLRRPRYLRVS